MTIAMLLEKHHRFRGAGSCGRASPRNATKGVTTDSEMIDNPLLDFSRLPRYASIRPEHVAPAIDELLARNRG